MTRTERLKELAGQVYVIAEEERNVKARKEELRGEIFRLTARDYDNKDYLLPVRTVEVPKTFWDTTGMTPKQFAESRFPGWHVEHVEKNVADGNVVFVLKKEPELMPSVIDLEDNIKVSKEVSEYNPEVDWATLEKELPELFNQLATAEVVLKLNEEQLEKLVETEPDILAKLQRHLKTKRPTLRMTARKLKDADEG